MHNIIKEAVLKQLCLSFDYENYDRTVEPHCVGLTTKNNYAVRAYQTLGSSSTGNLGWKMFEIGKMKNLKILDQEFSPARPGYKRGDKGMKTIIAEL